MSAGDYTLHGETLVLLRQLEIDSVSRAVPSVHLWPLTNLRGCDVLGELQGGPSFADLTSPEHLPDLKEAFSFAWWYLDLPSPSGNVVPR